MIETIRNTVMFSGFEDHELKNIEEMLHQNRLKAGEALFQQGQPFKYFYYVKSGVIKLSRISADGDEKVIEIIRTGQFFAEALLFLKSPSYPVLATAMKETHLIGIDAAKYSAILHDSIESCFRLLGSMSKRIHHLVSDIDALTLHSSKSRLAGYLLNCMNFFPGDTIQLELPKGVIASRLSMKPETFSRALHTLHDSGIIDVANKTIRIINEPKLREISSQDMESAG